MTFIRELYRDEIRSGYLVTSDIKKVWNRQLELWQEVDRICRKHAINYWAGYGTLLGAVRHGGFIPWDTDMDFCMMRPEFNRFCQIVDDELRGGVFEIGLKFFSNFRISHSQTTMLVQKDLNNKKTPKGLMIEIFPLDVASEGTSKSFFAFNAINELMGTAYNYPAIVAHVQNGGKTVNDWAVIESLHAIADRDEQHEFLRIFAEGVFDQSSKIGWIEDLILKKQKHPFQKDWFHETVYLPFESVMLPAPIDYEQVLTSYYGDWHKLINDGQNRLALMHSADIPYREFLAQADFKLFLPAKK